MADGFLGLGPGYKSPKKLKKPGIKRLNKPMPRARPSTAPPRIASVGSAAMDNEECWIYQTLMRSLGLVYVEHQARI